MFVSKTMSVRLAAPRYNSDTRQILYDAIRTNAADIVTWVIANREIDINTFIHDGNTALMAAGKFGRLAIAKLLIANGADANLARSSDHMTAVMLAAAHGHLGVVEYLVESKKAQTHRTNTNDETLLTIACRGGNADLVRYLLLDKGLDVNHVTGPNLYTPLMHLAQQEAPAAAMVNVLLQSTRIDIDAVSSTGWTALTLAIATGRTDIVESLLAARAIFYGESSADTEIASLLSRYGMFYTELMLAASRNQFDAVERIMNRLNSNADEKDRIINWEDFFGRTALRIAHDKGYGDMVDYLMRNGATYI